MIWRREVTLDQINAMSKNNMVGHLGIKVTRLTDDELEATMPVDERTRQPFGLLHGGASVVLAETLGSIAGYLCCEGEQTTVGVEVNASHLRSAREGFVRGVCRAIHLGRRNQVWQIDIYNSQEQLCCSARLTTMVI